MALNQKDQKREGRNALPSVLCIDSQSVKLTPTLRLCPEQVIYEHRGADGSKKVNESKGQLIVDVGGLIFDTEVHAANLHDGTQATGMLPGCFSYDARFEKVLGDQVEFAQEVEKLDLIFECASRPENAKGFVPVAKRWVVERTIAWPNFFRRLTKDYEHTFRSAKYWLFWESISIVLNRIVCLSLVYNPEHALTFLV